MPILIGADVSATFTSDQLASEGKGFSVGDRHVNHDGKEYVFVLASSAITNTYCCRYTAAYSASQLSTANGGRGDLVGVAVADIASGSYGWVQIKGPASLQVLASSPANARLNNTGSAGVLGTGGSAGSMVVEGVTLSSARSATQGPAPSVLNYPSVGVTL